MLKVQTQLIGTNITQNFDFTPKQLSEWDCKVLNPHTFHFIKDGNSYTAEVLKADYTTKTFTILVNKLRFDLQVQDKFDILLAQMGMNNTNTQKIGSLKAPMPGLLIDIKITEGQAIKKGDTLLVLEAMKMENVLKAPIDAVIKTIKVQKGENVEKNQVLLIFE